MTQKREFLCSVQKLLHVLPEVALTIIQLPNGDYSVFIVDPLHLHQLGLSQHLKECTVAFRSFL